MGHYKKSIKFVSSFLKYYPLKQQTQFPDLLISNDILLKIRYGDCLDYSNLLCSLLRGSGYNAFIVYGIAKYEITQNNQTNNNINKDILESTKWNDDDDDDNDDDGDKNEEKQNDQSSNINFEIPEYYQYNNNKLKKNNNDNN